MVSATVPDWDREKLVLGNYDPGKRLLLTIRQYQKARSSGRRLSIPFIVGRFRFWSAVCGADIPLNVNIEGGLVIPHPNGIVVHPDASIGPNCLLFHQVTIGMGGPKPGVAKIGGHVDIGAGAKILGGVVIGNHVKIGANSVVLQDLPDNCTAVGVPAKIYAKD